MPAGGCSVWGDHKVKDRRKPFPFGEIQIQIRISLSESWIPNRRIIASFTSVDSETSCCNVFCGTVIDLGAFVSGGFATCDWHVANRHECVWVSVCVSECMIECVGEWSEWLPNECPFQFPFILDFTVYCIKKFSVSFFSYKWRNESLTGRGGAATQSITTKQHSDTNTHTHTQTHLHTPARHTYNSSKKSKSLCRWRSWRSGSRSSRRNRGAPPTQQQPVADHQYSRKQLSQTGTGINSSIIQNDRRRNSLWRCLRTLRGHWQVSFPCYPPPPHVSRGAHTAHYAFYAFTH